MNYEFDKSDLSRPQRHPMRSVMIFLAVLAVTAGIVYCIVPHGKKAEVNENAAVLPAEKKETDDGKTHETVKPAAETHEPTPAAGKSTEKESTAESLPAEEKKTDLPVKGVPWSGDPAVDLPEKPLPAEAVEKESAASAANRESLRQKTGPWHLVHTVSRGDTLERLARKYHTTTAAIREMNALKSDVIYLGATLKIVPGPWRIEISRSARRLKLVNLAQDQPRFFASYDIGIGRAGTTPTGDFVIAFRLYHPDYLAPDGAVFAYGTPENPLGDYFLKLASAKAKERPLAGYGIHGSPDDAGVGRSLSHGCIRMRNEDVKELYLLCPAGTAVQVTD